jgi:acetolactate synthase-1/2/3 large subunit
MQTRFNKLSAAVDRNIAKSAPHAASDHIAGAQPARPILPLTVPPVHPDSAPPRAADHIIDYLIKHERVEVFFGLPGGAISPLDDALHRREGIRAITVRHESDAVFAATGYARASGRLGVALVTSGPGVLNAVNALASANSEGLPVLVLAGDAPRSKQALGALQEGGVHGLDILHLARSVTKASAELVDANSALVQLTSVIATMKRGRQGAGLVSCPVDVIRGRAPTPVVGMPAEVEPLLDESALDRAAELLGRAKRPLLFVGNGARSGDGPAAVRALAERLQVPVMTTPHAKGVFPESHALALGVYGLALHPSAVHFLEKGFDCLVAIATSFSELATNGWSKLLRPSMEAASTIQIDVDPSRIGRVYPVDLALIGPAAPALRSIANRITPARKRVFGVERKSDPAALPVGPQRKITPQRALWELQQAMPRDARYTIDSGEHTLYALHYLDADDPTTITIALGLASMGAGVGSALGLAAAPGRGPVAAIAGDGGFLMSMSAVATAAAAKLPIVFAILNDRRYGMCDVGYEAIYGRTPGFSTAVADISTTARGLGAQAIQINAPDQLRSLDLGAMLAQGPIVLDIHIDPEVRMFPNVRHEIIQTKPDMALSN